MKKAARQPDTGAVAENVTDQGRVLVGRVTGVFGVKGWLKVWSFTDPLEGIFDYPVWYLRMPSGWEKHEFDAGHRQGKGLVVHFPGCDDRDAARVYLQADIAVAESSLPRLPEGEFYWHQLEGLRVYACTAQGADVYLGRVDHLLETGANDVLVVQPDPESVDRRERLIPWLPGRVVVTVDLEGGRMVVDWDPDF